jgi:hypothetical protein
MPIILKGKDSAELLKKKREVKILDEKRKARAEKRTKYHLKRKDRTPEQYKGIQLFVDGREMKLSDSAKFFLEQLIQDEETT